MPHSVTIRLVIEDPLPGVELRVQRGRDALLPPSAVREGAVVFEFTVEAEARADGRVAWRGPEVQGPAAARFVYVNAGTYAGQVGTPWGRRAKVPLSGVSGAEVEAAVRRGAVLAGTIAGRARDGGPAAATVPLLGGGWAVVPRDA